MCHIIKHQGLKSFICTEMMETEVTNMFKQEKSEAQLAGNSR